MSRTTSERICALLDRNTPIAPRFTKEDNKRSNELQFFVGPIHAGDVMARKDLDRPVTKKMKIVTEKTSSSAIATSSPTPASALTPNFVGGYSSPLISAERQEVNARILRAVQGQNEYSRVTLPILLKLLMEGDDLLLELPLNNTIILNYMRQTYVRTREMDDAVLRRPKYPWEYPCCMSTDCRGHKQYEGDILMGLLTLEEMRDLSQGKGTPPRDRICLRCWRFIVGFMLINIEANKATVSSLNFQLCEFYNLTGKLGEYAIHHCMVSNPEHIQCLPLPVAVELPCLYERVERTEKLELPGMAPREVKVIYHVQHHDYPTKDERCHFLCLTAESEISAKLGLEKNQNRGIPMTREERIATGANNGGRSKKKSRFMHDALSKTTLFRNTRKPMSEEIKIVEQYLSHPLEPWFGRMPFTCSELWKPPPQSQHLVERLWIPYPIVNLADYQLYTTIVNHVNYIEFLIVTEEAFGSIKREEDWTSSVSIKREVILGMLRAWQDEFMPLIIYMESCTPDQLKDDDLVKYLILYEPFDQHHAFTWESLYNCVPHMMFCPIMKEEAHHPFVSAFDTAVMHLLFKAFPNAGKGRENAKILFQLIGREPRLLDFYVRILMASQLGVYPTSKYHAPFEVRKKLYYWFMFSEFNVETLREWTNAHSKAVHFLMREYVFFMITQVPALHAVLKARYDWESLEVFMASAIAKFHSEGQLSNQMGDQLNKEMLALAPRFNLTYFTKELHDEICYGTDIPHDPIALEILREIDMDVEMDVVYFLGMSLPSLTFLKRMSYVYDLEVKRSVLSNIQTKLESTKDVAILKSYLIYWRERNSIRMYDLPPHIREMQIKVFRGLLKLSDDELLPGEVGTYYFCRKCLSVKARVLMPYDVNLAQLKFYTIHNSRCGWNFCYDGASDDIVCKPPSKISTNMQVPGLGVSIVDTGVEGDDRGLWDDLPADISSTLPHVEEPPHEEIEKSEENEKGEEGSGVSGKRKKKKTHPSKSKECEGEVTIPINMLGKIVILNLHKPVALTLCPHCCNITSLSYDSYIAIDGIFSCGCKIDLSQICSTFCFFCSAPHQHATPVKTCRVLDDTDQGDAHLEDIYVCDRCVTADLRNYDRIYTLSELYLIVSNKLQKRYSNFYDTFYFSRVKYTKV
jgi:hypothetical protein